jgi:hypothetical protein
MDFEIPDVGALTRFTVAALRDLGLEAAAEFETLRTSYTPDNVTDEVLDRMDELQAFCVAADSEIANREARASRFATLGTEPADEDVEDKEEPPGTGAAPAPAATFSVEGQPTGATTSGTNTTETIVVPSVTQMAAVSGTTTTTTAQTPPRRHNFKPAENQFSFIAAPDTGFSAGAELADWDAVAQAFINRTRTYGVNPSPQQHSVAQIQRNFGDFNVGLSDNDASTYQKIEAVRDEFRLPGGSLLAGVGWCAPSETIYTTCTQVTTDGILSTPEIGARRGGIRHNTGLDFSTVFGAGTGFNILTEAQVISDTAKTCVAIPCPTFVDDRLKVAVLCITGDILQDRGYSEFVSDFIQAAVATQAHNVNKQIIADIVTGSTAVSLTGEPFLSDGSVVSQVMSAVEMAIVDMDYRLRLRQDATMEIVMPFWVKAQLRADWIRRNGPMDADLADAQIDAMFRTRHAHVQYVYDWQDFFATAVAGDPGSATAIQNLPVSLKFLAYPAGTWVVARQDVIRLDSIYDSTNITTNKVTQLFLEDGFRAMQFCPLSRVYTIAICPSGATGAQRSVDCVTP